MSMTVAEKRVDTSKPIGWDGRTASEMLTESERQMTETGHYCGIDRLAIKEDDPIRYEKIWSRLRGGLVGARETALNVSASPIVREIGELCFGLYTPEGDSITLSTGIMAHVHTMSEAIKHMLRTEYEENPGIEPGDIFVNNDPQLGDVHNADVMEFVPLFWEDELIGWAAGVTHEIDVGSPRPSSSPVGTINRYEDGFILSCEKVGADDDLFQDYARRSESATRTPFYWVLDEKCRISGCHIIRDTVTRLIREEGIELYKQFMREVIEDTRQAFVSKVKELMVPGVYRFPSFMDIPFAGDKGVLPDYAAIDGLMHCPLKLTVGIDASFGLDLDGASKWGHHSFNCTMSGLQGGLWVALCQTLVPNDKVNDGAYLATTFNQPYGTWANPDNLSVSNTLSWSFLIPCFTGLIHGMSHGFVARGFLEEVLAAYPFTGHIAQGGGINHYGQDSAWTNFEMSCCGVSARWAWDGESTCAAVWNPEGDMGDVEAWEILEPMLYLGRAVRPNSGGLGKRRGGSGYESLKLVYGTSDQVLYHGREGHVFSTSGLFGGYPGASGYRHNVKDTDMAKRIATQKSYPVRDYDTENSEISANVMASELRDRRCWHFPDPHKEYDLFLSNLAGGHGLGDVLERDPQQVADDINSGDVLPRFASAHGVVVSTDDEGKVSVDDAATTTLRTDMRDKRLARSLPVADWIKQQHSRVCDMNFSEPVQRMYRESADLSDNWARHFRNFWDLPAEWRP